MFFWPRVNTILWVTLSWIKPQNLICNKKFKWNLVCVHSEIWVNVISKVFFQKIKSKLWFFSNAATVFFFPFRSYLQHWFACLSPFLELQNLEDTTEEFQHNLSVPQFPVAQLVQDYKPKLQDMVIIHDLVQVLLKVS